jgi:hypothetical protein
MRSKIVCKLRHFFRQSTKRSRRTSPKKQILSPEDCSAVFRGIKKLLQKKKNKPNVSARNFAQNFRGQNQPRVTKSTNFSSVFDYFYLHSKAKKRETTSSVISLHAIGFSLIFR